jgi:hypothetical protein
VEFSMLCVAVKRLDITNSTAETAEIIIEDV